MIDDEEMERYEHTTGPKGEMGGNFIVTQPKSSDFFSSSPSRDK